MRYRDACEDGPLQQKSMKYFCVLLCICLVMAAGCVGGSKGPASAGSPRSLDYEAAYLQMREVMTAMVADAPDMRGDNAKVHLIALMGKTRDPVFVPHLLGVLSDANHYSASLADCAAEALGEIGDVTGFEPVQGAIASGRVSRVGGIKAMGRFAVRSKDERAAVFVTNALERSADWQSRVAAVDALEHEEAGVLPGLRKALEVAANSDRACTVRIHASLVLLRGGQKEYAEVLRRMAASPEQDVRLELAYSVGVSAPTVSVLLELLADTSPEVAGASWEQLSKAMPSVNYASPPTSPEEGREMARAYRKAWLERS